MKGKRRRTVEGTNYAYWFSSKISTEHAPTPACMRATDSGYVGTKIKREGGDEPLKTPTRFW
ncbi:hypothetical protein BRADI_2g26915v3 [Brachypodium distachyon]|uniref:Uncharacterized protein n=1 Tax=Brachypodium distachyon TaxID=15368 RepID=A0A0Q3G7U3_BRADI|nr:hypothetical protein BRADI_2g26915v3 [Brachypodium distachyon]